jgi:HSP20 family molecular chaperone IbpA
MSRAPGQDGRRQCRAGGVPEGLEAVHDEVRVPRYRCGFTLSRELDPARIEANLKDGVLTLRFPKQVRAQLRRIAVSAG